MLGRWRQEYYRSLLGYSWSYFCLFCFVLDLPTISISRIYLLSFYDARDRFHICQVSTLPLSYTLRFPFISECGSLLYKHTTIYSSNDLLLDILDFWFRTVVKKFLWIFGLKLSCDYVFISLGLIPRSRTASSTFVGVSMYVCWTL